MLFGCPGWSTGILPANERGSGNVMFGNWVLSTSKSGQSVSGDDNARLIVENTYNPAMQDSNLQTVGQGTREGRNWASLSFVLVRVERAMKRTTVDVARVAWLLTDKSKDCEGATQRGPEEKICWLRRVIWRSISWRSYSSPATPDRDHDNTRIYFR